MAAQRLQINLMNEYVREVKKRKLLFTKVQFYAAGVLIVYVAVLLVVLAYRGVLALQLQAKQKQIDEEMFSLTQLKPLEDKYLFVQNKLSLIQDFWGDMPDVRATLNYILPFVPEEVVITDLTFSDATNTVELVTESRDVFLASTWLNTLESQAQTPEYVKIGVDDLKRGEDGVYTITLTLYLKQG
jgi:Tfp pilus assembly protein PilN